MKTCPAPKSQTKRRIMLISYATALVVAFTVALARPARAEDVTPPPVPREIQVPAGNTAFLVGHATGTQNYICLPSGSGFAFTLFTPQATLFDDLDHQIITHYFSPNPEEGDKIRATWQHSDTSTVWAKAIASYTNPGFDARGDIPWVLLQVVGTQDGPTGGSTLSAGTTFVQRLKTSGGAAPTTGCSESKDVGKQAFMPYRADYFFYKAN